MKFPAHLTAILALVAFPCAALAQFTDTFNTIDPLWIVNRYDPAAFAAVTFNGDSRLQLTIDQTGSAASRPLAFSSAFYDIQGRQRPGGITGQWTLSAQVYVSSAFNTTTGMLASSALWGHSGTTPDGGDYMVIGFTNESPTDGFNAAAADRAFRFRALDDNTGNWFDLGVPSGFVFDAWHTLSGTSTGTTFEFRIDGVLVLTEAAADGGDLLSAMIQGYNFGQAGSYSVYWDNITASVSVAPAIANNPLTAAGTVGTPFSFAIKATGSPVSYSAAGLPTGLSVDPLTGGITGSPTRAGLSLVTIGAADRAASGTATLTIAIAPAISTQPANITAVLGGNATFSVGGNSGGAPMTYQWRKDGVDLPGATSAALLIGNVRPGNVGSYTAVISSGGSVTTAPALLAMNFTGQIAGNAILAGTAIHHPNGNVYDQVLLAGASASVKANPAQIVRVSFIDLNDDIVQVEMSGAGVLTLELENASGPAAPVKYNQPGVAYMKGHASIAITGADATTNVSVFSVGPVTAIDQTLFRAGTTYDGWADIALLTVSSADGHFGGMRTANASYFRTAGMTGVYAPGLQLSGPLFVGDIDAAASANAVLVLGSVADARITGGDLFQDNGGSVEVSGMIRLQFSAGTSSQGVLLPAQANRAQLMRNGVNVTSQVAPPN